MFADDQPTSSSSGILIFYKRIYQFAFLNQTNFLYHLIYNLATQEKDTLSDATMWEYRLPDNDEILGPFSTDDMIKKVDTKALKDGTLVRRIGTESFYDIKRIDFDLFD